MADTPSSISPPITTTNPPTHQPHPTYQNLSITSGPSPERDPLCAICFADMTASDQVLTHTNGTCLRSFHTLCLEQFFTYQEQRDLVVLPPRCPNCRVAFQLRPFEELQPEVKLRVHRERVFGEMLGMLHEVLTRRADGDYARIAGEFRREVAGVFARARTVVRDGGDVAVARGDFERAATEAFAEIHNRVVQEGARSLLAHHPVGGTVWYPRFWRVELQSLRRVHFGVDWSVDTSVLSVMVLAGVWVVSWYLKSVTNFDIWWVLGILIKEFMTECRSVDSNNVVAVLCLLLVSVIGLWLLIQERTR